MIRKLLATTAMAGLFATGAFAQETTAPATTPAAPAADSGAMTAAPAGEMGAAADAADSGNYLQSLSPQQHLVSELDDQDIYGGTQADAQSLGEIQNYLVEKDGKIAAAIVQATVNDESRTVALPFDQIQWSMGENNEPRATIADANALNSAPIFMERQAAATADPSMAGSTTAPAGSAASTGTGATAPAAGGTMAPAAGGADMAANGGAAAPAGETMMQGPDQYLTSALMGQDIRSGTAEDADDIGEVSDLVVSDSGQVDAAVVGVGGFLGIGQKNVAVPFGEFQVTRDDDGDEAVFVLAATREQLEQAPAFEGRDQATASNTAATGTMGSDMAATGAAAGAAAGAAVGNAADATSTAASNAGSAISGATETAQNQTGMATTGAAGTDAATTASTGGSNRDSLSPVENSAQLTADQLMGTTVYGPNDESLGTVSDIAMNAEGQVDAVIVDVGGFLGIGAKPVAVGLDNVQLMRDQGDDIYIYTQFSQDQLENAPAYDQASYAENRDTMRLEGGTAPAAGGTTTAPAAGTTAN